MQREDFVRIVLAGLNLDVLLRMLLYSRTEDQDDVDKEDDQVHRPLDNGCARSGESERAEHEGESEKGRAEIFGCRANAVIKA
jgi:mannose/fructose-specific phosphotransferase system component IIA